MILLALALFVVSLGYGVVVPQLPALVGTRDEAALSLILTSYAAAKIGLQVPAGVLADRVGRSKVIVGSMLLFCASLVPFCLELHAGVGVYVAARVVEGAATGALYPALLARAAELAHGLPDGGKRLGAVSALGTSGFLFGPALAATLAPSLGPRMPVVVALALAVAITVAAGVSEARARVPASTHEHAPSIADELVRLSRHVRSLGFVGVMLPVLANKICYTALQGLLPLVGVDVLHQPPADAGGRAVPLLFVAVAVCFSVGQTVGGALGDRTSPRRALVVCAPIAVAGLCGMAVSSSLPAFVAALVCWTLAASTIYALSLYVVARAVGGAPGAGATFGVFQTLTDVGTVIGPPLLLGVYAGVQTGAFVVMAAITAAAALGFALWAGRPIDTAGKERSV